MLKKIHSKNILHAMRNEVNENEPNRKVTRLNFLCPDKDCPMQKSKKPAGKTGFFDFADKIFTGRLCCRTGYSSNAIHYH